MLGLNLTALDGALLLAALLSVAVIFLRNKRKLPLPPGPKGLPIIGNVHQIPTSHEWYQFSEWADKFGDIVHLNMLGQPLILLGSAKHASALLDKRGNIYSDRPTLMMGGEMVGWKNTLVLTPYGDRFREYRKFASKFMGTRKHIEKYHELEEYEATRFVKRVLHDPSNLYEHIRKTAGAIILKLVYDYDVGEGDDALVNLIDNAVTEFSTVSAPGAFLVDVFPLLRYVPAWLPGASFQKKARAWAKSLEKVVDTPFDFVTKRMSDSTNAPNYVSTLLETEKLDSIKEFNIKWSAASIYGGGADTTVSSIYSFFLAMTLFPEVQKRAQAELDSVIGPNRLPSFADRPHLPYIEALVKEVFRWCPVAPLCIPHRLLQDDVYEGYLIPKGSIVIANIWKILHDPAVYPNPEQFDPTRYLAGETKTTAPDPRDFCFGFGRRICPGLHLADASVFISCAMALAVFNITKPVENGKVIEPQVGYTGGTINHPTPFKCTIKPRSARAEALIHSACTEERP